ncbi:MAG: DUF975 family protein [Eubacteriales bacterium]|nr:DUF975 family protein [Eubacteriales bacterium]
MRYRISIWKREAREAMRGHTGLLIASSVLISLLQFLAGTAAGYLFPGSDVLQRVLAEVFSFALTLVLGLFSAGMYLLFLNVARGKEASVRDLFYYVNHQPDRIIVASFVLAFLAWLTALPASIYSYAHMNQVVDSQEMMQIYGTFFLLYLLGLCLNLVFTIPLTLVYYRLADDEVLSGIQALSQSVSWMKGHYGEFILLQLSFIPWVLVGVLTFYLAFLWVIPYMEMSSIEFYLSLYNANLLAEAEEDETPAEI